MILYNINTINILRYMSNVSNIWIYVYIHAYVYTHIYIQIQREYWICVNLSFHCKKLEKRKSVPKESGMKKMIKLRD